MNKINRDKLFKSIISIGIVGTMLLLLSIPFIPGFNYSPLNVLGVEVIPTQEYRIQFDLPHIKPITPEVRQKAETHLSKLFGITQSNLKNGTLLSKPFVDIKELPITNSYIGSIKIGNATIPFSKVRKQFNKVSRDNELPSKELLTAYFSVNGKPLRANIFIMSSGSVLQYASMTLQDKDDNVLAMFTYGKVNLSSDRKNDISVRTTMHDSLEQQNEDSTLSGSSQTTDASSWVTEKVLKHQVKYITINDPVGNLPSQTEPAIRLDAMSNYPFNNFSGADNYLSSRTWGFNTQIESAYTNFYESNGWGNVYTYAYVNNIENIIETRFSSEINESNLYPKESYYSSVPIDISFNLFGIGSVSYPINVPYSGVKKTWTLKNTQPGGNPDIEPFNYGKFAAFPMNSFTWRDSNLFWKYSLNDALTNDHPNSSYGGFYCRYQTAIYTSGNYLYALYSSDIDYGIKVISTTYNKIDYYYISVSEGFPYVNLSQ